MHIIPEFFVKKIEKTKIPSPLGILAELNHVIDRPESTISDISKIIRLDAGLTSRILSIANSATYNQGINTANLDDCLIKLGTNQTRMLVCGISLQNFFEKNIFLEINMASCYWFNSLLTAELAQEIAINIGFDDANSAYIAGLLQDIGEILLINSLGDSYKFFIEENKNSIFEENNKFGTTHADIGAWLVGNWNLQSTIADSIYFHHKDLNEIKHATSLPKILWLANLLKMNLTLEEVGSIENALGNLNFSIGIEDVDKIVRHSYVKVLEISHVMGISIPEKMKLLGKEKKITFSDCSTTSKELLLESFIKKEALLSGFRQQILQVKNYDSLFLILKDCLFSLFGFEKLLFLHKTNLNTYTAKYSGNQTIDFFEDVNFIKNRSQSLVSESFLKKVSISTFEGNIKLSILDFQICRALSTQHYVCIPIVENENVFGAVLIGLNDGDIKDYLSNSSLVSNIALIIKDCMINLMLLDLNKKNIENKIVKKYKNHLKYISHEAGNPLGIIKAYLKIINSKISNNNFSKEISVITQEVDRISGIIDSEPDSKNIHLNKKEVNICDAILNIVALYREVLFDDKGILFSVNVPDREVLTVAEQEVVQQIIINLLKNSSEALKDGDSVNLSVNFPILFNKQEFIEIRVDDTGPGIPNSKIKALYEDIEILESQKRGMGLSLVKRLADANDISIMAQSSEGKGTSIALWLKSN